MKQYDQKNVFSNFFESTRMPGVLFVSIFLISLSCFVYARDADGLKELSSMSGKLSPFVFKDNAIQNQVKFNITSGNDTVSLDDSKWQCNVDYNDVEGYPDSTDVDIVIHPSKGADPSVGMGIEFMFDNWSENNYVFIPASVYNGNRFKTVKMGWPAVVVDASDRYHDIDPIIPKRLPHLNINEGPSKLNIKLNDASTPAIGFFSPELKKSFLLLIKPTRNFDITIEESADRKNASFIFSTRNKPDVYSDQGNNTFSVSFRMFEIPSRYPVDLLSAFFQVRKSFTEKNEFVNTLPFGSVFELQETLHNTERWDDSMKYYRQGGMNELDKFYSGVQLGWIGGMIEEHPLLTAGSELSRERSVQSIETILNNMQGESGLMYGIFKDGILYSDDLRNKTKKPLLGMARKNGDALYFLLQNLMILKKTETYKPVAERLDPKARKLADGLVNLWKKHKQFGQFFDVNTGELVVYGSTSGASVIGALALASEYFNHDEYLEVAEAAAGFYYNRDLKNGYTTGGPGEAMQCPDSESAFAILEGFVALYDITGKKQYLSMAEDAAAYFSTWVTSYDFKFPPQSALGKLGAKATGSVWANIQNRHGAPAVCNFSGDSLLKLYRATDNPLYLELLKDIAHNSVQYVSTAERPVTPAMHPGYVCERVNISSWEGKKNIGGNFYGSSPWVEVALMQTTIQVPSIYVDVKQSTLTVFDHLEAAIVDGSKPEKITMRVKNPTAYGTTCTVYLDFDKDKPMGWNNYSEYKKIILSANEEKVVVLNCK